MNGLATFILLIAVLGILVWKIWKIHVNTYAEILISSEFEDLEVGKVAVFKAGESIKAGDIVLVRSPGYELIWKVDLVNGSKLDLHNRNEELIGFPLHSIFGKMIGYKGFIEDY